MGAYEKGRNHMVFSIEMIDNSHAEDVKIKNDPFSQYGKMVPLFDGKNWTYKTELFPAEKVEEFCFPDEDYDFEEMQQECYFIGAYGEDGTCIGLALYRKPFYDYLYLEDLKVCQSYRHQGVGAALLQQGNVLAKENGYRGVYVIAQDDNLSACRFYVENGFEIGGYDNKIYTGTSQEGKGNIIFYKNL